MYVEKLREEGNALGGAQPAIEAVRGAAPRGQVRRRLEPNLGGVVIGGFVALEAAAALRARVLLLAPPKEMMQLYVVIYRCELSCIQRICMYGINYIGLVEEEFHFSV